MRIRIAAVAAVFALAALAEAPAFAQQSATDGLGGNVGLVLGQKTLHKNVYDKLATQTGFQLQSTWGMKSWPVMVAVDLGYNTGKKDGITATETEISLGARKAFMLSGMPIVPYAGAGVEYGSGTSKGGGFSVTATGLGIWGDGGVQYMFGPVGVGLDLRYDGCPVKGKTQGVTFKGDVGGFMAGLVGSFTF